MEKLIAGIEHCKMKMEDHISNMQEFAAVRLYLSQ